MKLLIEIFVFFLLPICLSSQSLLFQTANTSITSLVVSPDSRTIALEEDPSQVALWDISMRKRTKTLTREKQTRKADEERIDDESIMGLISQYFFSPDGQLLFAQNPYDLTIWNVKDSASNPALSIFSNSDFYDISSDRKYVAAIKSAIAEEEPGLQPAQIKGAWLNKRDTIIVYSLLDAKSEAFLIYGSQSKKIRFIPNTKQIILLGSAGDYIIYDLENKKVSEKYYIYRDDNSTMDLGYFTGMDITVALHPNSKTLVTKLPSGKLSIYDLESHKTTREIEIRSNSQIAPFISFEYLQFTPDGKYLLGIIPEVSQDKFKKSLYWWDIMDGRVVENLSFNSFGFYLSYSNDGKYFVISHLSDKFFMDIYEGSKINLINSINGAGPVAFFPNNSKRFACFLDNGMGTYLIAK